MFAMAKGSSSQSSTSSTATSVTDQRVGVADQGVNATSGSVVQQGNDFRAFDDHSSFSVTSTDSRDMSDHSVTNITTLDAEVTKAAIEGNVAVTKAATEQGTQMLESVLNYGDSVTDKAFKFSNGITEAGFSAVTDANKRSLEFGATALQTAVDAVTKSADADRAFASEFTGRIFETAKSADQANVEKIVKAITVILGVIAAAWAARSIFGKSKA